MYKILGVVAVTALLMNGCGAEPKPKPLKVKTNDISKNYTLTKNAAISGYNKKRLTKVSVEQCMTVCDETNWCKSFDYYKFSNKCDLSTMSAADVGGLKTTYSKNPYDHYAHIGR